MSSAEVKMGGGSVAPSSGGRLGPRVRGPGSGLPAPGSGLRAPCGLGLFFVSPAGLRAGSGSFLFPLPGSRRAHGGQKNRGVVFGFAFFVFY